MVTIVTVFRNLKIHRRPEECDASAPRLDEVAYCRHGTHIVVDHHPAGVDSRTDAVEEHKRNALVDEASEMVVFYRILGLRDNDAAHFAL